MGRKNSFCAALHEIFSFEGYFRRISTTATVGTIETSEPFE
jgi:hypothetical protein